MKSRPIIDINKHIKNNTNFRLVLNTTEQDFQVVAMNLKPNENIGFEIHTETSQLFYIVEGVGVAYIEGETIAVTEGDIVIAERGESHDIINTGVRDLKLMTLYSKKEHEKGKVQATKEEGR